MNCFPSPGESHCSPRSASTRGCVNLYSQECPRLPENRLRIWNRYKILPPPHCSTAALINACHPPSLGLGIPPSYLRPGNRYLHWLSKASTHSPFPGPVAVWGGQCACMHCSVSLSGTFVTLLGQLKGLAKLKQAFGLCPKYLPNPFLAWCEK